MNNILVCTKPGLLEYHNGAIPERQPGHAIIKIRRIGICGTDLHAFEGTQPYFSYPRVLGHELAGTIHEYAGDRFSYDEPVTIIPYYACGQCVACRQGKTNCCVQMKVAGVHIDGGMVSYLSVPEDALVKSQGLSLDELALVEPFAIGAHGIRRAAVKPDEFVVILGAGPIGLALAEFARIEKAKVIMLDVNEHRLQVCKQLANPHAVVKADSPDVLEIVRNLTSGDMANVVIDATGNQKAINGALQFLAHGGRYVLVGLQSKELIFSHPEFHKRETTLMSSRNATKEDFNHTITSFTNGKIDASRYISHRISFSALANSFAGLLDPQAKVIKAMVETE